LVKGTFIDGRDLTTGVYRGLRGIYSALF
jgi:hypothetical protein